MYTNKCYLKLKSLRDLQETPVGYSYNRIFFEMSSPQSHVSVAPNASWNLFGEKDPQVRELFLTKGLHIPHIPHNVPLALDSSGYQEKMTEEAHQ